MDEFARCAIQLELKYCERCGGLWLRPRGSGLVFCASCARTVEELMPPSPAVHSRETCPSSDGIQSGFWSKGGNA